MLIEKKKGTNDRNLNNRFEQLMKMSKYDIVNAEQIIDNSISNDWLSFYPIKEENLPYDSGNAMAERLRANKKYRA